LSADIELAQNNAEPMETDKWLSQFTIPDENALDEIRRLVGQLTPADFPKRHRRKLKDATATGSIDLILDLVTTALQSVCPMMHVVAKILSG